MNDFFGHGLMKMATRAFHAFGDHLYGATSDELITIKKKV